VFTAAVAPLLLEGEKVTARAAIAALGIFGGLVLVIWGERRERREVPVASMVGE
jgi:drug/metabolite transporter (DMT)-like permease